jgi:hypothetical protein
MIAISFIVLVVAMSILLIPELIDELSFRFDRNNHDMLADRHYYRDRDGNLRLSTRHKQNKTSGKGVGHLSKVQKSWDSSIYISPTGRMIWQTIRQLLNQQSTK